MEMRVALRVSVTRSVSFFRDKFRGNLVNHSPDEIANVGISPAAHRPCNPPQTAFAAPDGAQR